MTLKILYHGSSKKLMGDKLIPKRTIDLGKNPENLIKGVYATDIKELAIAMAIICSKGVNSSGLNFKKYEKGKSKGIIYEGWPNQKEIYLYILPSRNFTKSKGIIHQFVSEKPVKPLKIERLKVENYLYLVKKADDKEKQIWEKKYNSFKLIH